MNTCHLDVRAAAVGYVTAMWQQQPGAATGILADYVSDSEDVLISVVDLLDAMADMVVTVAKASARVSGADVDTHVGRTLAVFGRIASGD